MSNMGEKQDCASDQRGLEKNIKVTIVENDLERVKELQRRMPSEVRKTFEKTYGRILDLLLIPVEESVLSALTQFWNRDLRCFEFPNMDMVPTIEEYETMIRRSVAQAPGPYLYRGSHVREETIAVSIGLRPELLVSETRGSQPGWRKSVFEDHLEALARQGDWDHFRKTLALLMFGLVLFPVSKNLIDRAAMDVFHVVQNQGRSFVPAILAETLLSLGTCKEKKGGKLKCCSHMLYVWIMTHLFAKGYMGPEPDPLRRFSRIPLQKKQGPKDWKNYFASMEERDIRWFCPWYESCDTTFCCGDFLNVPLMGPRGIIRYTLAVAVRQLRWTQDKPNIEALGGPSCIYAGKDDRVLRERTKTAWENVQRKNENELGPPRVASTQRYRDWRASRVLPQVVPKVISQEEESTQTKESLISQLAVAKAQLDVMKDNEEAAETKILILEHKCQKKEKYLERLKDEMADMNTLKKRKEAPTESQVIRQKYEALKERLGEALKENKYLQEKAQRQDEEHRQMTGMLQDHLSERRQQAEDLSIQIHNLQIDVRESMTQLAEKDAQLAEKNALLAKKDESIAEWIVRFNHEREAKRTSWRECDNMSRYVHRHGVNILRLLENAKDAINANRGMTPLPVYTFVRYCEQLVDQLGVRGIDE